MKYFCKKIKNAFSLMELTISILIVSVLIVVSVPLIQNQMKKTDEYAYFLAFKTVEKLGSQIVALGDPLEGNENEEDNDDSEPITLRFFEKIAQKILPQAQAQKTVLVSFPSYEYDMARICNGNENVIQEYGTTAGMLYTKERLGITDCDSIYTDNARLNKRFSCNNAVNKLGEVTLSSYLKGDVTISGLTTNPNIQTFCTEIALPACTSTVPAAYQSLVHAEYKLITLNQSSGVSEDDVTYGSGSEQYGQCIIYIDDQSIVQNLTGSEGTQSTIGSLPVYSAITCQDGGYINMAGTLSNFSCNCDGTNPILAVNNPSVCCPTPSNGNVAYAKLDRSCVANGCPLGAYDERNQKCCPAHSFYSKTIDHCVCAQDYTPSNSNGNMICTKIENATKCPTGYHYDDTTDTCVINLPITKAQRFCELIADYYNVSSSNCNTFNNTVSVSDAEDISYNSDLYNAITANDTPYLSSRAIEGAFNDIDPNIIFTNGLKLWILGDKVASIAGLSFDPTGYTPDVNVCADRGVYTKAECNGENDYFCNGSNRCFKLANKGTRDVKLEDARNCCPVVEYQDLQARFAGNSYLRDPRVYGVNGFTIFVDITGNKDNDKGGGTLWKDVFPFYVSANGKVFPAYPLTGSKAATGTAVSLYQGGNSSALATDVYYYDMVNGQRKKQVAYSSIPYARAQCFALQVSAYTPYCENLGAKFRHTSVERMDQYIYSNQNPCYKHRCHIHLKNKIKFL